MPDTMPDTSPDTSSNTSNDGLADTLKAHSGSDVAVPDLSRLPAPIPALIDLLGACVMCDRLARDAELVEFCNAAQLLAREVYPEMILARWELRVWFHANGERLRELAGDERRLGALLEAVEDSELRQIALGALYAVTVCDYHTADEEARLLRLACRAWAPARLTSNAMAALDL